MQNENKNIAKLRKSMVRNDVSNNKNSHYVSQKQRLRLQRNNNIRGLHQLAKIFSFLIKDQYINNVNKEDEKNLENNNQGNEKLNTRNKENNGNENDNYNIWRRRK